MASMKLTSHLPDDRRMHVEGRLRANLMAWLTTVRPDGRPDSVPVDGTAEHSPRFPAADQVPEYVVKYAERIGANFGTASQFAALFSEALIVTPHRLYA
jgi:hypothetical protein